MEYVVSSHRHVYLENSSRIHGLVRGSCAGNIVVLQLFWCICDYVNDYFYIKYCVRPSLQETREKLDT